MTDQNRNADKRDQGRALAIEGMLRSRFGERPCSAANNVVQVLRSSKTGSRARSKPVRKRDKRRRFQAPRQGQRSASSSLRLWIGAGLSVAAALLLTVWFISHEGPSGTGPGERVAGQGEPPDEGGSQSPDTEKKAGVPLPGGRDAGEQLAGELEWTSGFKQGGSYGSPNVKVGSPSGSPDGGGFGGAPDGSVGDRGKGSPGGQGGMIGGERTGDGAPSRNGGRGGLTGGRPPKGGRPPIAGDPKGGTDGSVSRGNPPEGGLGAIGRPDGADASALKFPVRIPKQLSGKYVLTQMVPKKDGDGVMLLYARDGDDMRFFVCLSVGPDKPFEKVEAGKRVLLTARKSGLLIAVENGPADPTDCEPWLELFVAP